MPAVRGELFSLDVKDLLLPTNWSALVDPTDGTPPTKQSGVLADDLHHERIVVNVSGLRFETQRHTLERYPGTLLGDELRRAPFYRPDRGEFFFDRHRSSFEAVLHFYQSGGELRRPCGVPPLTFVGEVLFFDLGDEAVERLREEEGLADDDELEEAKLKAEKKMAKKKAQQRLPSGKVRRYLWNLFEHPDTSTSAKATAIFSLVMVLLSVVTFCVETLPTFRSTHHRRHEHGRNDSADSQPSSEWMDPFSDPLFLVETVCIAWFCLELLIRSFACPDKLAFARDPMNIVDLISILPYVISLAMDQLGSSATGEKSKASNLAVLRTMRLLRVCRILKLSRHCQALHVLAKTLRASFQEIVTLLIFVAIAVVLFASAIYFAEVGVDEAHFSSVPDAFWWAVVTLTTVGYGDMTPVTLPGKLVGSMCALSGVLLIALPVPVIVNNFTTIYELQKKKMMMIKKKMKKTAKKGTTLNVKNNEAPRVTDGLVVSSERSRQKCSPCGVLCCLRGPRRWCDTEEKLGPRERQQNELRYPLETKV
ncbi:unnamed protein product [Lampetra fluviatilis]